jgi:hypothetical protein
LHWLFRELNKGKPVLPPEAKTIALGVFTTLTALYLAKRLGMTKLTRLQQVRSGVRVSPYLGEDKESQWGIADYKGKVVLDVGADVGSTADFFLAKGARWVIAVEGNRYFYSQLKSHARKVRGIIPVYMWINKPEHYIELITKHVPDVMKVDCEGCEIHLFNVPDKVFSLVPEYIVETHSDATFNAIINKCRRNNYEIVDVNEWTPKVRIVYAKRRKR